MKIDCHPVIQRAMSIYRHFVSVPMIQFAQNWLLPACLAIVIFGQLSFLLLQFRFGIAHPAWPFWGAVSILTFVFGWQVLTRLSIVDFLFLAFVACITVAFLRGHAPLSDFIHKLLFFITLPYVAGRVIKQKYIWNFLLCSLIVCTVVMVNLIFELTLLPADLLYQDRILLYFDRAASGNGGASSQAYVAFSMGGLIVILASLLLTERTSRFVSFLCGAGLFLGATLLVIAGTRSILIAVLAIVISSAIIVNQRRWQLRGILVCLVFAGGITGAVLSSSARVSFLLQVFSPNFNVGRIETVEESPPSLQSCLPRNSTSISLRIFLLRSASKEFMTDPVLGVGLGNFSPIGCDEIYVPFDSPHNIVAHALVEGGLILGSILVVIMLFPLRFLITQRKQFAPLGILSVYSLFFIWEMMSGNIFGDGQLFAVLGLSISACFPSGNLRGPAHQRYRCRGTQ